MPRIDVRCKVDLPVNVVYGGGQNAKEKEARFSVISLNGAYVDCDHSTSDEKIVGLRYELPKHGEFEMLGEVVRRDNNGMAIKFHSINRDTKIKLWDFIKDNIVEETICPYCKAQNGHKVRQCNVCGWDLNFIAPDYLVKHEKESFISRLASKSTEFNIEEIYKILNYVDVEILGIGKSWEINEEFVGSSKAMLEVFSSIRKVAPSDLPVFITGENGTGKEMTARAIHERSSRKEKVFSCVNCSVLSEDLLDRDLFGYEKGAFPGADSARIGKLEYSDGGTVFLAEVTALSPNLQSKLMKFLDDGIVESLGSKNGKKVDVRIIAGATKRPKSFDAHKSVNKAFFDKINVFSIGLIPVRERGEDKLILARYFLNRFSKEMNVKKTFARDSLELIKNYDWPGNVREIINRIRRSALMSADGVVRIADMGLTKPILDVDAITTLRDVKSTLEKQKLVEALDICKNNISKTAKVLGISRPSVYSLKRKYGI